jgi:hypothetical protein
MIEIKENAEDPAYNSKFSKSPFTEPGYSIFIYYISFCYNCLGEIEKIVFNLNNLPESDIYKLQKIILNCYERIEKLANRFSFFFFLISLFY